MSRSTDLDAAIDAITSQIKFMRQNTGPDVNINGRTVNKQSYIESLERSLDVLRPLRQREDGPFMVKSTLRVR